MLPFYPASVLMKPFRELDIPAFLDTSAHDLTRDFFAPLLFSATRYDRGVGAIDTLQVISTTLLRSCYDA